MAGEFGLARPRATGAGLRVSVARLTERMKRKVDEEALRTTIDAMHAADERVFESALKLVDKSTTALQAFVRDHAEKTDLKNTNALQHLEGHLNTQIGGLRESVAALTASLAGINQAIAGLTAALAQPAETKHDRRLHPVPAMGAGGVAMTIVWGILYFSGALKQLGG